MNRLWIQLSLAFALVVLVTVAAVAFLADLTAGHTFRRYLTYSGTSLHQSLDLALADYYQAHGSWAGVEQVLPTLKASPRSKPSPRRHVGPPGPQSSPLQIVLADQEGRVVYDDHAPPAGRLLTREEMAAAQDIELDGQVIGRLVLSSPLQEARLGPLEQVLVGRLRWLLAGGALLAGLLGILLGLAVSRNLTAPLQRLATAARAVANRDFSQRVEVQGSAEMAEVGQAFNDMAAALAESDLQRQQMVADVAHELRSPLAILQGNLRAMLDDVYPLEKAEIARLYDETRLLSRLVDDLRDLALADAGKLRLDLRPTDVAAVIESTVGSLAAAATDLDLRVDLPADLPPAQADPDRLAQAVLNLVDNAVSFSPEKASVEIKLEKIAGEKNAKGCIQISIADRGPGIPGDATDKVFERWYTDRPDEETSDHTGLGLAIVKGIVEGYGGRISITPGEGGGTMFLMEFPE